jgi:hypothetical protein
MMKEHLDPIAVLERMNPIRGNQLAIAPGRSARLERTWDVIRERMNGHDRSKTPAIRVRRRGVLAAAVVAVLAIPALAFSGIAGSLFGFGNQGTAVSTSQLALSDAQTLRQHNVDVGAGVKLLAVRSGLALYASRTTDGETCFLAGPAEGTAPTAIAFGTPCASNFPSADKPILGDTVFRRSPVAGHTELGPQTLAAVYGLAADGVASVEVLDADGGVIANAPVTENVYSNRLPTSAPGTTAPTPTKIVALDAAGKRVYTEQIPQMGFGG